MENIMHLSFKQRLLVEQQLNESKILLENICRNLTQEQQHIVQGIYREFLPLIEATLTTDQVKQLFTSVEQGATASGTNRSGIGKAVDVAKLPVQAVQKVNDIINKAGQWAQNTKPVQAFDQKFEDLKAKISAKFPNLAQNLSQAGDWAKANPGKTAVIIGVLTAVASLAGGPVGGAIAGQVLRGTAELMKGEKLSTAVGKGAKSAVMGFLAGKALEYVSDQVIDNTVASGEQAVKELENSFKNANYEDAVANLDPNIQNVIPELQGAMRYQLEGNYNAFQYSYDVVLTPEQVSQYNQFQQAIQSAPSFSQEEVARTIEFHNWMNSIQQDPNQNLLRVSMDALKEISAKATLSDEQIATLLQQQTDLASKVDALKTAGPAVAAAVQGAVTAAEKQKQTAQQAGTPAATGAPTAESLRESTIRKLFYTVERKYLVFNEGIGDTLKGLAGKAGAKIQQVGANLTTKVTADKLLKAWQAAGSPTDSDAVAEILRKAGVDDSLILSTYQAMNITPPSAAQTPPTTGTAPAATGAQTQTSAPAAAASGTPYAQLVALLPKLDKKGKINLSKYLQTKLGTV